MPVLTMVLPVVKSESTVGASHESVTKPFGNHQCPHCCQAFETAEALHQHDKCMIMPSDVIDAARSGNGTISSVGMKLDGKIQCSECKQKFDTEQALRTHCRFIHDRCVGMNIGYTLEYEFDSSKRIK